MACTEKKVESKPVLHNLHSDDFWGPCCSYWRDIGETRISEGDIKIKLEFWEPWLVLLLFLQKDNKLLLDLLWFHIDTCFWSVGWVPHLVAEFFLNIAAKEILGQPQIGFSTPKHLQNKLFFIWNFSLGVLNVLLSLWPLRIITC